MSGPSPYDSAGSPDPFRKILMRAMSPLETFIHQQTSSGLLLMACAVVAIVVANSPLQPWYENLLHTQVTIGGGALVLSTSLHHWINDGLMALFFFVVGLEVKREMLIGELADFRQAILPIASALGGMIVPALIYTLITFNTDAVRGWGIPMATDIAFALGVVALLGDRVPKALVGLLLALAIVDDLGAVLVIAVFYTENIHFGALALAGCSTLLLVATNLAGVRRPLPYLILGVLLWLALLKSGVHATLAGVIAALTVPPRSVCNPFIFITTMTKLTERFQAEVAAPSPASQLNILRNTTKQGLLQTMSGMLRTMESPLQRMEDRLHVWVSFVIVPIFALANAGISIDFSTLSDILRHPVSLGVMAGLVLGKTIGIFVFAWLTVRLGWSRLPAGVSLSHLAGMAMLAGIGFTMAIFIGGLAFVDQPTYLLNAKIGIILASLTSGIIGFVWLGRLGGAARP